MYLEYFFDRALAHASYLVGCQQSGEALVIDPSRNIEPYLAAAKRQGLRIAGAAETHIHADFVSGARELADRAGARLYLSDEGPAEWKYGFAGQYDTQLLKHGDVFHVGRIKLETLHTPGHTPESVSFLLTDEGGGANEPMGIFTGDFVFVGSIGRPDLLETAAGVAGSAEQGARQLYHSMRRFRELPDHLQVWPAHGAGSACGKGLGSIPSSTVGYEKRFNPALRFDREQAFVDYILADQPETPPYFAVMKRVNKAGPELLRTLPPVEPLPAAELRAIARRFQVVDTRPSAAFAAGHVPETINLPEEGLVFWAGFLVDYGQPLYLIAERRVVAAQIAALRSIGIDRIAGFFPVDEVAPSRTESYRSEPPEALRAAIEAGAVELVDVRAATEFQAEHIAGAKHHFLGTLPQTLEALDRSKPQVVQCLGGGRSAIAASLLKRSGFDVIDMQGGLRAWRRAGLPVQTAAPAVAA